MMATRKMTAMRTMTAMTMQKTTKKYRKSIDRRQKGGSCLPLSFVLIIMGACFCAAHVLLKSL
jgi:hypothetical protein